jgi:hypothetical protein
MNSLLRKEECAAKAGISVRMLDYHFKAGTGPRRTFVGSRTYVDEGDLYEWILKRRRREGEQSLPNAPAEPSVA